MERRAHKLITLSSLILAGAIGLTGCAPGGDDDDGCFGKCDGLGDGVSEALASRTDPVARFLRENGIDDKGFIDVDWGGLLVGVADVQGCDPSSLKTFVVSDDLISGEVFPRLVATACSDDASKASEFFIAASFESPDEAGEMDFKSIEAFAWDSQKRRYQFYESFAAERGGVRFDVEPTKCRGCHLTTADMEPTAMHMTPVMNELFRPWTHWNASPGFPSFDFEVPDRALESNSWDEWVMPWSGQADQLELLIKAGQDKVALARLRERRDSVDIDKAMGLLRPVFCSEQVNYVSEDFGSGQLLGSTILDPGLRQAFFQVRPDNWPWPWLNDQSVRLPAAGSTGVLKQMPVRGNADLTVEKLIMSTKVLTPEQVLQVRALDYVNPVFSEFRCGLWKEAKSRFEGTPPDLSGATRISHAIPILFDNIMVLGDRPIKADGKIVAVAEASAEVTGSLFLALGDGSLTNDCSSGACSLTLDELGAELQTYYETFSHATAPRDALFPARDARLCKIVEKVKPADDRFDNEETQRECGEICCEDAGMAGDEICIGRAAAAAKAYDNSEPLFECAVQCASPSRFPNRPSLPSISECETSSVFLP